MDLINKIQTLGQLRTRATKYDTLGVVLYIHKYPTGLHRHIQLTAHGYQTITHNNGCDPHHNVDVAYSTQQVVLLIHRDT